MYCAHIEFSTDRIIPTIAVELTSTLKKKSKLYTAWIDTGATHTVLSKKILKDLKLHEVGFIDASTPTNKNVRLKTYRVLFHMDGSDNSKFCESLDVVVAEQDLNNCDVLIGLDILHYADFTHYGNNKGYLIKFKEIL